MVRMSISQATSCRGAKWNHLFFKVFLFCFFCSCIGAISICNAGETERTNDLWLGGIGDKVYFTEWNRFPMKFAWNPNEPFPINLWREEERLRQSIKVVKGIKEKMTLGMVDIRRINPFDRQLVAHGRTTQDFTNQWFVEFIWDLGDPEDGKQRPQEYAVMLLDGTLVAGKRSSQKDLEARITTNSRVPVASSQSNGQTDSDLKLLDQLVEGRRKLLGRMNLAVGRVAATKNLNDQIGHSGKLEFTEVWLFFRPVKSHLSGNPYEVANNVDWVAQFIFKERPTLSKGYAVDVLFDGTILQSMAWP